MHYALCINIKVIKELRVNIFMHARDRFRNKCKLNQLVFMRNYNYTDEHFSVESSSGIQYEFSIKCFKNQGCCQVAV